MINKASLRSFPARPFLGEYRIFVANVRFELLQLMEVLILLIRDVLNHAVDDAHPQSFLHLLLVLNHHQHFLLRFLIILLVLSFLATSLWTFQSRLFRVKVLENLDLLIFRHGSF